MPTSTSGDNRQLLEQLVQLTEAVRRLAERPDADSAESVTAADRIRQRVAFGYQVLGTLTGRVSSASGDEFDVPVVAARRRPGVVEFDGLPPGADFVELRSGDKAEVLRIHRDGIRDDPTPGTSPVPGQAPATGDTTADATADDAADYDGRRRRSDRGLVRPDRFADAEPIGSIVFLRNRRGPLIAFGPRLAAVSSDPQRVR